MVVMISCFLLFPVQAMAQQATAGRRYLRAFVSGFFVAVPVTVTVLDRFAYVARVEGASMQVRCYNASTNQSEREILTLPVFREVLGVNSRAGCNFSIYKLQITRRSEVTASRQRGVVGNKRLKSCFFFFLSPMFHLFPS